jgi:hypothetical protein
MYFRRVASDCRQLHPEPNRRVYFRGTKRTYVSGTGES